MNIAPPPLPEEHLHKFSLRASGQLQSRFALRTSILRMFRYHRVGPLNPTEMMCHRAIRVEHCLCSIRRLIEGLMRLGKDWTLMLQPYLILSFEVLDEDRIRRLANQDYRRPLYVQDLEFILKTLKRFNVGT